MTRDIQSIKNIPTAFVIFGATGDLARKKIFPSLYALFKAGLLPEKLKIVAAARTPHTRESLAQILKETTEIKNSGAWNNFIEKIDYLSLDVAQDKNLDKLAKLLEKFEKESDVCIKRIFYMAISPAIYEKAVENLGKNNLHLGCQIHNSRARIIVEKPFGHDLASATKLNSQLLKYFSEDQIYRIDHFLGKETVQNIFAFRFANEIFEPIWNNHFIDHVQITLAEHIGIEKRGEYYETAGALRDVVQNHLLQLVAIATMDQPAKFDATSINAKKMSIIKHIRKLSPKEIAFSTVRGQYDGYRDEEKVDPKSQAETFALAKLFVDTIRWHGVPFYIRTGKKLMGKVSSIIVQFKKGDHMPNHITLQIQPTEGIGIRLVAKKPGFTTILEPVDMEFCYKTSFDVPQPDAYERLLLDIILGDQTLFLSQEIIEESWKIIDPIRRVWDSGKPKLAIYKPGSWGPKEADELIEKDGRTWLAPLLTICKI